jgi:heparan-alpha-glucosaminide N-acetyltransferase
MAISFEAMRRRGASRWDMARRVLQRAVKLYALGCFLNGGASLQNWRLLGVLQYFAMSYMVVGLLEIFVRPAARGAVHAGEASTRAAASSLYAINDGAGSSASRGAGERHEDLASSTVVQSLWRDLGGYWLQWAIMLLIGAVYVCVQTWMAVPGCPSGYIGPGGAADGGAHSQCTGGAHRVVDLKMFTPWHVYHSSDYSGQPVSAATCADVYGCQVYDPEGVLGWISACWMTFLGLQAGRVFTNYKALLAGARDALARRASYRAFLQRWAIWGVVFGLLGASLAGFKQDGGVIPINKNLWSPSFIFTVAGIDFLLMGLLYVVVDLARAWSGAPFAYVGMNSIVVYCGHEILGGYFPFEAYQGGAGYSSHAEFLTSNVFGVLCWVAIARVLYLKKIFINL